MNLAHVPRLVDEAARQQLAADGLRVEIVDDANLQAFAAWFRAESRGFYSPHLSDERVAQRQGYVKPTDRRTAVLDETAADPATPVATFESWVTDLTVPGGRTVAAWAISGVTVAPTHRRRGITRALMEGELRTAAAAGVPLAMLTVSESTIYGRFGFAPAALARDLTIDTRRARWTGPEGSGRVHLVDAERLRVDGPALVERVRLASPGQMRYDGVLWDRQLGLMVEDDEAKTMRFVRYDDASEVPQGFAVYQVKEDEKEFTRHTVVLLTMVTATADAYAGLWQFLLEMDLVATVTAHLRPADEPLRWMVADFKAVHSHEWDHLWTRILDVKAALEARTYPTAGRLVLTVTDPLGHADGTWSLDVDPAGRAQVEPTDEPADATLTVDALSALHLGGIRATQLVAAGRLSGDASRLDAMFSSAVAPYLSIWF
ncbi:MAG: family N-acetyltransferase [Aeromicrobium sp.]|nr:family N-acetyltransferase [Aeromicrobium sp.]